MRLPDLEDGFLFATQVLEVERDEAEMLVRVDRMELALMAPMTRVGGAALHRSPGEIATRLFVGCSLGRIVPRNAVSFGWLMVQRALVLSDLEWRWRSGDRARFSEFKAMLEAGEDPGTALTAWMSDRIVHASAPA